MKKILFSGKDVEVRYNGNINNIYNVIVFRCAGNLPIILKDGSRIEPTWPYFMNFEDVFVSDKVNEVYIDPLYQHMYQTSEMDQAINSINKILKPNSINVTFGLSMGGFGAVNFSNILNAKFISLSPSATHTGILPISERVKKFAIDYNVLPSNIELNRCNTSMGYVFFDYYNKVDRIHAFFIKNHTKAYLINEPFWGHSNADKLNECYNIKELVYDILYNKFKVSELKKRIKLSYYKTPHKRYVNHILKQYLKNSQKDITDYLDKKIDLSSIKNVINISTCLIEQQQYNLANKILENQYLKNNKNVRINALLNQCYENMINFNNYNETIKILECKIFNMVTSLENATLKGIFKSLYNGKINDCLYNLKRIVRKKTNGKESKILKKYIIKCIDYKYGSNIALKYFKIFFTQELDTVLSRYKESLELINKLYEKNNCNFTNKFVCINNNLYRICKNNIGELCVYNLINYTTGKLLRHFNGKIIESFPNNDIVFKFDSSFFILLNKNKISFRCSNPNLLCWFINNDKNYIITRIDRNTKIENLMFDLFTCETFQN